MNISINRIPERKHLPETNNYCKTRITVAGPSKSGVSFVSGIIAGLLSSYGKTSLIELGDPYFYQALDFEKRFAIRSFKSVAETLKNKESIKDIKNIENSVNWLIKHPKDDDYSISELYRLFQMAHGEYLIYDCSGLKTEITEDLAAESSCVVFVVDPLPTSLLENSGYIQRMRLLFPDSIFIANKMNKGVHKAEFEKFLSRKDIIEFPYIPPEHIYSSEYRCILPWQNEEIKKLLGNAAKELKEKLID